MSKIYVVLNENTLGRVKPGITQWLKPLAFKAGGYDPAKGDAVISPRDNMREATADDFLEYGLDPYDYVGS